MKTFVAVLALVACVTATEWTVKSDEQIKQIREECLQENHISPEQLNNINNLEFPNEEPVRQYILCFAVKSGLFCPHQGYHTDRIAQQFKMNMGEEQVKSAADACLAKIPRDNKPNDVYTFEMHKCFLNSIKQRS
ncbi:hypothetical protein FF38_11682 [Lucilia cuprina]|uniref:Uncharacterized protein n=1 Tax=Lucilia cuprina TaxID=7375 RepID=A0A0L0CEF7_LUCCU|nr:hypothetical protein FF38_11682 [Lucilia cuprina]